MIKINTKLVKLVKKISIGQNNRTIYSRKWSLNIKVNNGRKFVTVFLAKKKNHAESVGKIILIQIYKGKGKNGLMMRNKKLWSFIRNMEANG